MNHQEVELWARDIAQAVETGQPVEDSLVELKSTWPIPRKAADRLAGHANAARGAGILWLIGIDEKTTTFTNVDYREPSSWYAEVTSFFDGDAPRLVVDVNVRIGVNTIVALHFETSQGAPFVVTFEKGSYPQFVVPWRESTGLRTATRVDLLRVLVPIRRISALIDELDYNFAVVKATPLIQYLGAPFKTEEFNIAISEGLLATLPPDVKDSVTAAYIRMNGVNTLVTSAMSDPSISEGGKRAKDIAWTALRGCLSLIENARSALSRPHE